jgi:SCP-2 sterol transfer family
MQDRSDTEILAWIASIGGTRVFLDQAFSSMSEAVRARRADVRGAVIEWDIRTPDQGTVGYQILLDDDAETGTGSRLILAVDMPNFLRLLVGALDGDEAVSRGMLQVSGETVLADTIREWFRPAC